MRTERSYSGHWKEKVHHKTNYIKGQTKLTEEFTSQQSKFNNVKTNLWDNYQSFIVKVIEKSELLNQNKMSLKLNNKCSMFVILSFLFVGTVITLIYGFKSGWFKGMEIEEKIVIMDSIDVTGSSKVIKYDVECR